MVESILDQQVQELKEVVEALERLQKLKVDFFPKSREIEKDEYLKFMTKNKFGFLAIKDGLELFGIKL